MIKSIFIRDERSLYSSSSRSWNNKVVKSWAYPQLPQVELRLASIGTVSALSVSVPEPLDRQNKKGDPHRQGEVVVVAMETREVGGPPNIQIVPRKKAKRKNPPERRWIIDVLTRVGFEPTPFRTAKLRNPEHSALDRSAILPCILSTENVVISRCSGGGAGE